MLVLHGPNLNLLGTREPDVYGSETLAHINDGLVELGRELGASVNTEQSNHEGQLIDWLHDTEETADGIVFNPGAYTHTSIALRDALAAISAPCVEVHLTQIHGREGFRHRSITAECCIGMVSGFGSRSYALGLRALIDYLTSPAE